ncbi:translation initiation factor IF-2-like [Panicum virgatum]|uniref:Uncharacterized protein n=1 Tax=Panicum virgatum TaxID=38727 RepID=A0A8T0VU47_PANVG|nr:translation initiation factor IF-2-like [Panicum virgatum]KAG2635019.1 hypothetical protein PVAP13_2NG316200 [Panicum virgatum]
MASSARLRGRPSRRGRGRRGGRGGTHTSWRTGQRPRLRSSSATGLCGRDAAVQCPSLSLPSMLTSTSVRNTAAMRQRSRGPPAPLPNPHLVPISSLLSLTGAPAHHRRWPDLAPRLLLRPPPPLASSPGPADARRRGGRCSPPTPWPPSPARCRCVAVARADLARELSSWPGGARTRAVACSCRRGSTRERLQLPSGLLCMAGRPARRRRPGARRPRARRPRSSADLQRPSGGGRGWGVVCGGRRTEHQQRRDLRAQRWSASSDGGVRCEARGGVSEMRWGRNVGPCGIALNLAEPVARVAFSGGFRGTAAAHFSSFRYWSMGYRIPVRAA